MKITHLTCAFIGLLLNINIVFGTGQVSDWVEVEGKSERIRGAPLQSYLASLETRPQFPFASTACWRGYVANWKVEKQRLYLQSVNRYDSNQPKSMGEAFELSKIFPNQKPAPVAPVFAQWFTGSLIIPIGDKLRVGYSEKHRYLVFKKGELVADKVIDNCGFGSTRCSSDITWVLMGDKAIPEGEGWIDLRDYISYQKSDTKKVTIRGVYFPREDDAGVLLVSSTPTTEYASLDVKISAKIKDKEIVKSGRLEVVGYFDTLDKHFVIHEFRKLDYGETIHREKKKQSQ